MPPSIEKDTRPQTTTVRTNQVAPAAGAPVAAVKKAAPPQSTPLPQAAMGEPPQTASTASLNSDVQAKQRGKSASGPATKPGVVHASGGSAAHAKSTTTSSSAPSQLSQLERDVQAKKAAASQGPQPASRPGAVNVDTTSAAGLEDAVMRKVRASKTTSSPSTSDARAKQQARPTGGVPASKPGAVHASGGSAAHAKSSATSSSAPNQLSQLERDVQAKKAAAPQSPEVVATKPGAVRAIGGSNAHTKPAPTSSPSQLTQLERDVQAKKAAALAGAAAASRPGAVTMDAGTADGLESAVMRKSRAVAAVSPNTNRKPAPQLSQFERDVQVKNAARGGGSAAASSPGAVSNDAAQTLDDAIARKVRGERQASRAPPPSQLSRLESDATAKAAVRRSPAAGPGVVAAGRPQQGRSGLHSFEAAVARKIRSTNGGGQQSPSNRSELSRMEEDALAKAGPPSTCRQVSGGRTQLRQLECDAKVKASVVGQPSDGRAHLNKLDDNGKDYDNYNAKTHGLGSGPDLEFGTDGDGAKEGLAVAVAIEEDEEEAQVDAVAIEYDPDAKPPPFHKTKLFRKSALIAFFCILAAGGAAIAGILLTKGSGGDGTPYRETLGIREEIETLIGAEELESFESPYTKALDWITHKDPMALVPADVNFFQRYIMAYLYFATTVKGPWRSCNPPVGRELEFCYFEFLDKTESIPPTFDRKQATRWLTSVHECSFAGVKCDSNKRVLELLLNGSNLSGKFPLGIVHLPFLQTIRFGASSLTGPLPADIPALKHLGELDLQHNQFTGALPKEWSQARKLSIIELRNNQLDGTIPPEIQDLKDLTFLSVRANKLSGPIPSELGNLSSLLRLNLGQNDLVGTIPTELGQLSGLLDLIVDQNLLTGTLPPHFGNMTELMELRTNENSRLGGSIPEGLYHLKFLAFVFISGCNFTGPLSPAIGNLTDLFTFEVQDNHFTGPIPAELTKTRISNLFLQNNDFEGNMPDEICEARGEVHRGIKVLVADCAPNPSTNQIKVNCDCCTKCCGSDGGECVDELLTEEWEKGNRR